MSNRADNMETKNVVCEKAESGMEKMSPNVTDILSRIDMIIAQSNALQEFKRRYSFSPLQ